MAGLLADQDDAGARIPLAEDGLRGVPVERARGASGGLAELSSGVTRSCRGTPRASRIGRAKGARRPHSRGGTVTRRGPAG